MPKRLNAFRKPNPREGNATVKSKIADEIDAFRYGEAAGEAGAGVEGVFTNVAERFGQRYAIEAAASEEIRLRLLQKPDSSPGRK